LTWFSSIFFHGFRKIGWRIEDIFAFEAVGFESTAIMFSRMFGKPKQETNAVATLDKLNEVPFIFSIRFCYALSYSAYLINPTLCVCLLWLQFTIILVCPNKGSCCPQSPPWQTLHSHFSYELSTKSLKYYWLLI